MVVWQGITAGGTAVPVQVTESGEVVAATNTPVPGPEGPQGPEGPPGADGKNGKDGKDGDQWIEVNSRLIKPTNNVGISVLLDAEFGGNVTATGQITGGDDSLGTDSRPYGAIIYSNNASAGTSAATLWLKNGRSGNIGRLIYGAFTDGTEAFSIYSNGTANFYGAVTAPNVTFNLDPDNSDNYVSTTNAETGETESVYSGPTLDVKQTLLTLLSKVEAIEARLASTGSVPED